MSLGERASGVAQVDRELAELWRLNSEEDQAVVRACTMNLIVVCTDGQRDLAAASADLSRVVEATPGRLLVVVPAITSPEGRQRIEAYVSAHCRRDAGGAQICCEQVTLEVPPGGDALLPGTLLQLLVEEAPVFTWWRRDALGGGGLGPALRAMSDRFIVDSAALSGAARGLAEIFRLGPSTRHSGGVADLGWVRLDPWREAVASLFDLPERRAQLALLQRVRIVAGGPADERGITAAAASLAGWIASRLDLLPTEHATVWRRPDGGTTRFELTAAPETAPGEPLEFRLATGEGAEALDFAVVCDDPARRGISLSIEGPGCRISPRRIQLPHRDTAALLCGVLQSDSVDPVGEDALRLAARFAER